MSDGAGADGAADGDGLAWRCRCGSVSGRVRVPAKDRVLRIVCHCRDCQAIQHFLGRADDVLDAHGGTDIAGVSPAALRIDGGRERLVALRLAPGGLTRWHAGCCDTPLANTPNPYKLPHMGVHVQPLRAVNPDAAVDAAFGPVTAGVFGRDASGGNAPGAHPKVPLRLVPSLLASLVGRRLRGEHRASTLFDGKRPIVEPRVLADDERAALAPYRS